MVFFYAKSLNIDSLDVTKLIIKNDDPELIDCLHKLLSQLKELECGFDTLRIPNLPVLNLEKLSISGNMAGNAGN